MEEAAPEGQGWARGEVGKEGTPLCWRWGVELREGCPPPDWRCAEGEVPPIPRGEVPHEGAMQGVIIIEKLPPEGKEMRRGEISSPGGG